VQLLDLARTVLEEAGLPTPPALGGRSLRGVVEGKAPPADTALLEVAHRGTVVVGSRSATEKYVRRFRPQDDSLRFDLSRDPGERAPLPPPGPEKQRILDAQIEALLHTNPFCHVLRVQAVGRVELALEGSGYFEEVKPLGLGPTERSALEDAGRTLKLRLEPRPGRSREVSFRVRPAGATVRLSGTWNGRSLGAGDVAGAVTLSAAGLIVLPDPEAEPDPAIGSSFFARPDRPRAAIAVWLQPAGDSQPAAASADALEALRALGYVGK
jgi:hypothetical protein